MPMAFMMSATPSSGVFSTSGSLCWGKESLKWADEYSLHHGIRSFRECPKRCTSKQSPYIIGCWPHVFAVVEQQGLCWNVGLNSALILSASVLV